MGHNSEFLFGIYWWTWKTYNYLKKLLEISFYTCTKNHNHVMYGSCDTDWGCQNFLSFWAIFGPFIPLTIHKIKILNKWKNTWRKYWFKLVHHDNHIMHGSWDTKHDGQDFLSFRTILYPFTPLIQKIKIFKKIKKNTWSFYHFTNVYHEWQSYDVWFLRYVVWQRIFCHFLDHFLPLPP